MIAMSFTYLSVWSSISSIFVSYFYYSAFYVADSKIFLSSISFKFQLCFLSPFGYLCQLCHQHIKDCLL